MPERPVYPTLEEVTNALIDRRQEDVWVAVPAKVQSYDARRQVADCIPLIRDFYPDPDGSGIHLREELPVVPSVQLLFPRVGKWFLAMSVSPGDTVQLLVNTLAIGHWRRGTGELTDPHDLRRQHLAHSVALVGLDTYNRALEHAPPLQNSPTDPAAALVLGSDLADGMRVSIFNDGSLKVTQGNTAVFQIDTTGVAHFGPPADTKPVGLDGDAVNATGTSAPPVGMAGWMAQVTTFINGITPLFVAAPPTEIGVLAGGATKVKGT